MLERNGKREEWSCTDIVGRSDFVLASIAGPDCIIPEEENALN